MVAAQRGENSGRVLGATSKEEKGASCFAEPSRFRGASNFVVHVDVGFEGDVFGDVAGIKIFGCVAVPLEMDERVRVAASE